MAAFSLDRVKFRAADTILATRDAIVRRFYVAVVDLLSLLQRRRSPWRFNPAKGKMLCKLLHPGKFIPKYFTLKEPH